MAHLWTYIITEDYEGLAMISLDNCNLFQLTGDRHFPVKAGMNDRDYSRVIILKDETENGDLYVLLTGRKTALNGWIRINGDPVHAGIRVLKNLDEIMFSSGAGNYQRLYFSIETKAKVECFNKSDHEVSCMRCQQKITYGDPVVRCPLCKSFHHQSDALPCWRYAPTCGNGMCCQTTDVDEAYRWIPDYLVRR